LLRVTVTEAQPANGVRAQTRTTVYVCTTCRKHGDPTDAPRVGADLAAAAVRAAENTDVTVQPVRCLANCNRGCSVAMRRDGAWTYVFGQLEPTDATVDAIIVGARLLAASADGLMPWRGRPEPLKRGLIARIPPLDFAEIESKENE
jgi:predicted metal-binding protein